ncbi:MAG: DUF4864 domain-containing protein [Gammaproteobacteria bacterium]|nr:DUF4864 domain-containing protein [Gammaproteobacteria bacterium]
MTVRTTLLAWLCGIGLAATAGVAAGMCGGSHGQEHVSSNQRSTLSVLSDEVLPSPEHPPARVVAIQLEALRLNDEDDRGIAVAFRFASPANKALTGPLPRFAFMIHNGPYRAMLDYSTAIYDPVVVMDRKAVQRVTLVSRKGTYTYVFYLSRQAAEPCRDCWMTDAVTMEPVESKRV